MKSELLKKIADGGEFDPVEAIRELAKRAVVEQMQSGPVLAEVNADDLGVLLNTRLAKALAAGGFRTADEVKAATDSALLAVDGVNEKTVALIREKIGRG